MIYLPRGSDPFHNLMGSSFAHAVHFHQVTRNSYRLLSILVKDRQHRKHNIAAGINNRKNGNRNLKIMKKEILKQTEDNKTVGGGEGTRKAILFLCTKTTVLPPLYAA